MKEKFEYIYPCCGKVKLMTEVCLDRAVKENRNCKECHMKKMWKVEKIISDVVRQRKSANFKNNNPSKKKENREKISIRMKNDNPVKKEGVVLKIRLATINQRNKLLGSVGPMYNPKSIPIIEQYGRENNYNFRHAENHECGEYHIKELGYWVDGFDEHANVVIEFDEKDHFNLDGQLKKKDIIRQNEIIKFLKCKFIRIKYDKTITILEYGS